MAIATFAWFSLVALIFSGEVFKKLFHNFYKYLEKFFRNIVNLNSHSIIIDGPLIMKSTSLSSIFSELSKLDEDTYPPVEKWNPPLCENVHMKIDRAGKWYFMDSVIGRERMIKLFSRVLRLDQDGYYLVTPVEKLK